MCQISEDPRKQNGFGECGGVAVLLGMCDAKNNPEARLLVPVLWGLRNCLHNNAVNKTRFVTAGGLEVLVQVRSADRSLCHSKPAFSHPVHGRTSCSFGTFDTCSETRGTHAPLDDNSPCHGPVLQCSSATLLVRPVSGLLRREL